MTEWNEKPMQSAVFNISDYQEQIITVYPKSAYKKSSNYANRCKRMERKQEQEEERTYFLAQKFCGFLVCFLGLIFILLAMIPEWDIICAGAYICMPFGAVLIFTKERAL